MTQLTNVQLLSNAQVRALGLGSSARNAEVLDLQSGQRYNIVWGGQPNTHTDFSPLARQDTDIMRNLSRHCPRQVDGWSWTPRPVVMFINGHQLAASVHHWPHGSLIGHQRDIGLVSRSNTGPFPRPDGAHMCMYFSDSVNNSPPVSAHARQMQVTAFDANRIAQNIINEGGNVSNKLHWRDINVAFSNYKVIIKGKELATPETAPIFNYNGWIYASAEHISKANGLVPNWDEATQTLRME